jgi:hypothetical protein
MCYLSLCFLKNGYFFNLLEKLFDVASECPDSLDFDRNKRSNIWTPDLRLLTKLNE